MTPQGAPAGNRAGNTAPSTTTSGYTDLIAQAAAAGVDLPPIPKDPKKVMPWLASTRRQLILGSRAILSPQLKVTDQQLATLCEWAGDRRAALTYWQPPAQQGDVEAKLHTLVLSRNQGIPTDDVVVLAPRWLPENPPQHLANRCQAIRFQTERAQDRQELIGSPAPAFAVGHVDGGRTELSIEKYSGRYLLLVLFRMDDPDAGPWLRDVEELAANATKRFVDQEPMEMLGMTGPRGRLVLPDGESYVGGPTVDDQKAWLAAMRKTQTLVSSLAVSDRWLLETRYLPPDRTCTLLIGPEGTVRDMVMGTGEDARAELQRWQRQR